MQSEPRQFPREASAAGDGPALVKTYKAWKGSNVSSTLTWLLVCLSPVEAIICLLFSTLLDCDSWVLPSCLKGFTFLNLEDIGIPRIEIVIVIVIVLGVAISLMIELNPVRNAVLLRTLNFGANSMFSLESRLLIYPVVSYWSFFNVWGFYKIEVRLIIIGNLFGLFLLCYNWQVMHPFGYALMF